MNANVDTFIAFLTDAFQNLAYASGSYSGSKHEESIRQLLIRYGFKEFHKGHLTGYNSVRNALPKGHFVCQPAGSNGNPDFLIRFDTGQYQDLEAKSTKGSKPMYNGVPPKPGCIYILSSDKHKKTCVFHADDIMTPESRRVWDEYVMELRKVDAKFNAFKCGWTGYSRQMFDDKSTSHYDPEVRSDLFEKVIARFAIGPVTQVANAQTIPLGKNITLSTPVLSEIKNA